MSWDYSWQADPAGGTLSNLSDYCRKVRLLGGAETIAGKRGLNTPQPYRHGALAVPHKFTTENLIALEITYRLTDPTGAVTHPDGGPGHVYENKATVEQLLSGVRGLAAVRRTTPDHGQLEALVELAQPTAPTQNYHVYQYVMNLPGAFWSAVSESSASVSPLAVGGNAPIGDGIFEIIGGTDVVFTLTDSGAAATISGATPAGGVRIDLSDSGTLPVHRITGGTDYHEFVSFSRPYGLLLEPGNNPFTISGGGAVTARWHDKVR